jgi:16S rRNA (cytosine967-C5)-methyltransferase
MAISQARKIAFDVLLRVVNQNAYADDALRAALDEQVKSEDAGLATELTLGVLRWQRLLDFVIDGYLKKPADLADAEVRIALRLGIYQLMFLDRVPARAAVDESVELVKRARKRSAANMVNAILRKAAKESLPRKSPGDAVARRIPEALPLAERMGIQYSHPTWLVERWIQHFGQERTGSLLLANNHVPTLSVYLLDPERRDEAAASLSKAGCRVQPGRLLRDAWVLQGGNPSTSEAVKAGWVVIQDEASQAVARLVAGDPGNSVLDLCAAPGGKTLLISSTVGAQGHIIAADLHANRVRAMKERFEHAGVRNIETIAIDGAKALPVKHPFNHKFDRILVDVPCSGTGTLARHPEIRWKLRLDDLRDLHERQAGLLRNALPHLAPEGRLVYSTCSLEPEENESVVREVLGELGDAFQIADARPIVESLLQESVSAESAVGSDRFFRTFPGEHATDGFFGAVIQWRNSKA